MHQKSYLKNSRLNFYAKLKNTEKLRIKTGLSGLNKKGTKNQ